MTISLSTSSVCPVSTAADLFASHVTRQDAEICPWDGNSHIAENPDGTFGVVPKSPAYVVGELVLRPLAEKVIKMWQWMQKAHQPLQSSWESSEKIKGTVERRLNIQQPKVSFHERPTYTPESIHKVIGFIDGKERRAVAERIVDKLAGNMGAKRRFQIQALVQSISRREVDCRDQAMYYLDALSEEKTDYKKILIEKQIYGDLVLGISRKWQFSEPYHLVNSWVIFYFTDYHPTELLADVLEVRGVEACFGLNVSPLDFPHKYTIYLQLDIERSSKNELAFKISEKSDGVVFAEEIFCIHRDSIS